MPDDLQPDLDGGAPRRPFPRVFVVGEGEARRDTTALAAALAEQAETVTIPGRADLIVSGPATDGVPDPSDLAPLEEATCPVAVAPHGLAGREGYGLRRIDVGIDGSRGAGAALAIGVRLAVAHSARLRLIAVAEPSFDRHGTAGRADPREVERLSRHLENATDGLAGVQVETELREGLADQIVVDLARDADLLVLGSRTGYGSAGRIVVGDVSARILRAAPCPVMVVPAP
jgi:nucleotide-binding universal stress UspA family protein